MSKDFVIPIAAARHNLIALGKTRSGKSSKLRVMTEYLLEGGSPVCILDPKGDWWGLKSSADGKRAGFPIVIFGGEHADVPINEHSGAHVAEIIATGNRPALIDLGGWMVGARTRFFVDFAATFFRLARGARHLVIDEVHNFAPQGRVMDPDAGKMLHWANRLASEGSGKGITLFAASQRPQKVHKDFVTSCETLIACKVIHKLDRDAIKDWIDGCADATKGREVIADLAQLKKPEAWAWCPEVDYGPERVTFPMFRTYDSFKPQPADLGKLKGWADVDLEDVKTKLAGVVKEAESNDPKKLKARIAELEGTLRKAAANEAPKIDTAPLEHRIEILEEANKLQREYMAWASATIQAYRNDFETLRQRALTFAEAFEGVESRHVADRQPPTITKPSAPAPAARRTSEISPPVRRPAATSAPRTSKANGSSALTAGPRQCLTAIAQYADRGGVSMSQMKAFTGYATRSVTTHVSSLRVAGYVAEGWPVFPTDVGLAALGDYEPLPHGRELRDYWLRELPEGPRRILELLVDARPRGLNNAEIVEQSDYALRSVTTHVSSLKVRCLLVKSGGKFHASEDLFG